MKRPATWILGGSVLAAVLLVAAAGVRFSSREPPCGAGFVRTGARCCAAVDANGAACPVHPVTTCPAPLVPTPRGCDAPEQAVVEVPATTVRIGPSDWEAEGRVAPRTVRAGPFRIDRLEATVGRAFCPTCPLPRPAVWERTDPARAAGSITLAEARAYCRARAGRLPTDDEWIVAAAGDRPRRYPWGDTGAVCRRAAWGLRRGPCGAGADGPDTVGAHPDGATPLGIHDLAGNVAEWVETLGPGATSDASAPGVVRGGAFDTELATELRTWLRRELPVETRDAGIGVRCAYDVTSTAR